MNLSYYHKEFFQTETSGVKLYPDYKRFGEFVFCLRYLLDGTQEERVFQRMRLHWLMQCAIADRKLMRILSSVVIRVVLFRNSTCLVWVSTLFPRPGIAPDVELYQNLRKEALNNTRQIPNQNSHMSQHTPNKQSHKPQQTPGQTSHMSPQTPIRQSHMSHHTLGKQSHITQHAPSKQPHTSQPTPGNSHICHNKHQQNSH